MKTKLLNDGRQKTIVPVPDKGDQAERQQPPVPACTSFGYSINPRHLVVCLVVMLGACEPYVYDTGGYVPYRGAASSASGRPENCGTPDQPKRCPPYRPASRKESSAGLANYNDRTY
jgi:hypothetical protein